MRRSVALLVLLCVFGPASNASAAVVISFDETYATVGNGSTSNLDDQFNTGGTIAAATLPGYSSTTTSLFNPGSMSGSFVQSRAGDVLGYSIGAVASTITTDVNVSYSAFGSFSNSAGFTLLYSHLYDYTTSSYVFRSDQESSSGAAAFTLGGAAGNYYNNSTGSLTGTLLAGHTYQWLGQAYTYNTSGVADGGATA